MKKILYLLLISSLILTVAGCSEKKVLVEEPTETPVVEEPLETPVEEPAEPVVEEPVVELEPEPVETPSEDEEIILKDLFAVAPGPLNDGDVMVGQGLVSEFFTLLYSHGEENTINEETREEIKAILAYPDKIDEIITSGELVLAFYEEVKVIEVTSVFSEAYELDGLDTMEYKTVVHLLTNGEEDIQEFTTYVSKIGSNLKMNGYN